MTERGPTATFPRCPDCGFTAPRADFKPVLVPSVKAIFRGQQQATCPECGKVFLIAWPVEEKG